MRAELFDLLSQGTVTDPGVAEAISWNFDQLVIALRARTWWVGAHDEGNLEGHVKIKCIVSAAGTADNCQVMSEDPAGEQFGAAALRASHAFRFKPRFRNCVREGGAVIGVPLDFTWRPDLEFHLEVLLGPFSGVHRFSAGPNLEIGNSRGRSTSGCRVLASSRYRPFSAVPKVRSQKSGRVLSDRPAHSTVLPALLASGAAPVEPP